MSKTTRREFLRLGLAAAGGALAASAIEIPLIGGHSSNIQTQLDNVKTQLRTVTGFITLSVTEQAVLEPIVETIIPSDTNGPGAKEAGVIYFIDRQLGSDYGQSANMFMDGPFILPGQTGVSLSVNALDRPDLPVALNLNGAARTYTAGTAAPRVGSGINYQYPLNLREFWRVGLLALQKYSNFAYSGNFQTLSGSNQIQVLKDLWSNKPSTTTLKTTDDPTGFSRIISSDFAYELVFMTWAGFLMDPLYGGNQNMVGWTYTGYNGVNFGNFYGEGLKQSDLMVATSPTRLKPASLAQYQAAASGGS